MEQKEYDVLIVGGGFTGLAAAWELVKVGKKVLVLEADDQVGGLAGSFRVGSTQLEKFYHHWFTNDSHIIDLATEIGTADRIVSRPTRTGMYYANNFFRLSKPKDLLKFTPLPLLDRFKLGLLALKARKVENWKELENLTASEWLITMGGKRVFEVVWQPLLRGKFGDFADEISAVWFWNKLKLRGGSRGKAGEEVLAYYKGGFSSLAETLKEKLVDLGGELRLGTRVEEICLDQGKAVGVVVSGQVTKAKKLLITTPLPLFSSLLKTDQFNEYKESLAKISYIGNVCLVLELKQSLSETYWLNVNDPDFPYVAVIEHTNFEPTSSYQGRHIVYLSKYLPVTTPLYKMDDAAVLEYSLPHLQRMFPAFSKDWIIDFNVWRAEYSQPIIVKNYSKLIPDFKTPVENVFLCSMAQVYPEDRGTNYAIRNGRVAGKELAELGG